MTHVIVGKRFFLAVVFPPVVCSVNMLLLFEKFVVMVLVVVMLVVALLGVIVDALCCVDVAFSIFVFAIIVVSAKSDQSKNLTLSIRRVTILPF